MRYRVWSPAGREFIQNDIYYTNYEGKLGYLSATWNFIPCDDFILSVATGLFDKRGQEIYEGDIVESSNDGKDGADSWGGIYAVVEFTVEKGIDFNGFTGSVRDVNSIYNLKYLQIVENIYEDPDFLLEEEE